MSRILNYHCNGCSKIRGDRNHWFIIFTAVEVGVPMLQVEPWNARCDSDGAEHFCSMECVKGRVAQWCEEARRDA